MTIKYVILRALVDERDAKDLSTGNSTIILEKDFALFDPIVVNEYDIVSLIVTDSKTGEPHVLSETLAKHLPNVLLVIPAPTPNAF